MSQNELTQKKYQLDKRPERKCVICESNLVGRSDKVFCGIQCKNKYHAEVRKSNKTYESETMKMITKNYIILAGVLSQENSASIKKTVLQRLGFNFDYVTQFQSKNSGTYFYIFDFCFYFSRNENVIIHKDPKQSPISPFLYKRWSFILPLNQVDIESFNKNSKTFFSFSKSNNLKHNSHGLS